jgi:O-antigen ligase/predicted TPR repeat methyltransferase
MKDFWNGTLVTLWALCVLSALAAFGGVVTEYALPMYLCGAALALAMAMKLFWTREVSWIWTPLHAPVLALLVYVGVRYFTVPLRHEAHWELLRAGLYTLVYFVTAFTFYRARFRTAMLVVLIVAAALEAVYGYGQYATGSDKVFWFPRPTQYHGRASGSYICPNHLAGWLEVIALVLLAQIAVNPRPVKSLERSFIVKLLEFSALAAVVTGLVFSGSRGGWLALIVGAIVFWIWAWRTRLIPPRVADAMLVAMVLAVAAALAIPAVRQRCQEALSVNLNYTFSFDVLHIRDTSMEGRIQMNQATWRMFLDHPWFGVGPGAWRWFHPEYRIESSTINPHYAHNDLLQFAAEYGMVGMALLVATLGCFFWQALTLTRRQHLDDERAIALGSLLAICALLAHSLVDFNMHIPANALLIVSLVGLTGALGDDAGRFHRQRLAPVGKIILPILLFFAALAIAGNAFRLCSAQRHLLAGRGRQSAREWTEAINCYRAAIADAPYYAEAYARIGEVYLLQRTPATATNALAAYQRALELNPRDATVVMRTALAYETLGNTNNALAAFQRVFTLDPHNADHWIEFGQFQERLGNKAEALRAYQKAARVNHPEVNHLIQRLQHQNR